jgi:hypothetical protein
MLALTNSSSFPRSGLYTGAVSTGAVPSFYHASPAPATYRTGNIPSRVEQVRFSRRSRLEMGQLLSQPIYPSARDV